MLVKCPRCGRKEKSDIAEIGDLITCDCGFKYSAGCVRVKPRDFTTMYADIACPYCGTENAVPSTAVNRDVRCSSCNEKFRIFGTAPVVATSHINASLPINAQQQEKKSSRLPLVMAGVVVCFIVALILSNSGYSTLPLVLVDDDVCVAKYNRELMKRDYAAARRWAGRISDSIGRKTALQVIEGTEKGMRSLGF